MSRARSSCRTARAMREKPTLILLHGGPGMDHSIYKPGYSALADVAQVIYLDHRGNGRSDAARRKRGPSRSGATTCARSATRSASSARSCSARRSAARWRSLMRRAIPEHPAKLILISTEAAGGSHRERRVAMFERLGGPEVGALARRRFFEVRHGGSGRARCVAKLAMPLLHAQPARSGHAARAVGQPEVLHWFARPAARATPSTCWRTSRASSARPW